MIALCLSIVSSVTFGHLMKWASHRRANLLWVTTVNYVVAGLICAFVATAARPTHAVPFTIATGVWGGVCYLISLLYYFAAIDRLGMGLATSAIRLSVALPVAAALLIWHEPLGLSKGVGLALVLIALPLLAGGNFGSVRGGLALAFELLLPLFLVTGLGQLANRVYSGGAAEANTFLFLAALFGSAAVAATAALVLHPVQLGREDLLFGALLGAVNLTTTLFLLLALRALPSSVVFSVTSVASVVLATLTGMLVWRERLQRPAMIGVAAAALAVVLLTR